MRIERWLTVAGYGTWLVSALPTIFRIVQGQIGPGATAVWVTAFVAFGIAFGVMCVEPRGILRMRGVRLAALASQSCAGLTMVASADDLFPAATLVVVAGQLDEFSPRIAATWVIVQTIALGIVGLRYTGPVLAVATAGSFGGFQLFALVTAWLTTRERRAREALMQANIELVATRAMLAENSRASERLRISRDLHDTLGHHLTALSLQLEVASRLADGKAAEHVRQAHAITRLLLSDVREVVSELRGTRFDLRAAVRSLAVSSGALAIHLDLPEVLEIDEPLQGHALLKCVQEIITNASRHAAARNLWIQIDETRDGITVNARDDGQGVGVVALGNGLIGMRERFEEHSGHVEFRSEHGRGFEVHGFMPKPRLAS